MSDIRDTYARCHAVLYIDYDEPRNGRRSRRIQKLALFRDLKEALEFFQRKIAENNAVQMFIEPPMLDGEFTTIKFGENDL